MSTVKLIGITNFPPDHPNFSFSRFNREWLKEIQHGLVNGLTQSYKSVYQLINPGEDIGSPLPVVTSQSERRKWNKETALAKTISIITTAYLKDDNDIVVDEAQVKVNVTFQTTKDWAMDAKSMHPLSFALQDLAWNDPDGTFSTYLTSHGLAGNWPSNVTSFDIT